MLQSGAHAITANKGVLVYGFQELNQLALAGGKRFLFESAVLDSAPVFSLFRETLPAVKLRSFQRHVQFNYKRDYRDDGGRPHV